MIFFTGWHQPNNGPSGPAVFEHCLISVARLWRRRTFFDVNKWILDCSAFKTLELHGDYTFTIDQYAKAIAYWSRCGEFMAAVSPDFMCEQYIFEKRYQHKSIRYSVADHQKLTICHYDALRSRVAADIHVMPVLQGFEPEEYVSHIRQYGDRLHKGVWVGVGSVCKRQGNISAIERVLLAIHNERPDLKLHGFGVKVTALRSGLVWNLLHSADSQAHGFQGGAGSKKYVEANNPSKALDYAQKIKLDEPQFAQLRLM